MVIARGLAAAGEGSLADGLGPMQPPLAPIRLRRVFGLPTDSRCPSRSGYTGDERGVWLEPAPELLNGQSGKTRRLPLDSRTAFSERQAGRHADNAKHEQRG
jgi:hypothetical protein